MTGGYVGGGYKYVNCKLLFVEFMEFEDIVMVDGPAIEHDGTYMISFVFVL